MPYIGNQPGTGVRSRFIYTATASQTTFTGADNNGKTLKYADSDYIDVFLNGVCLVPGTDYTASTKTSVVLGTGASASDTLEVVAYDIASIADTVSKADGGTFEANVTFANGADLLTASAGTDNVRLGEDAGASIASGGNNNVVIGKNAGTAITTGDANVVVGRSALAANQTGSNNTAVGHNALITSTGDNNTALGYLALQDNSSGTSNVAIGREALANNTTTSNNTAVGHQAGKSQIAGSNYATYIGSLAGESTTGTGNTFVGANAGNGDGAGRLVTSGAKNTILGGFNGNQSNVDIRTQSNNVILSDGDGTVAYFAEGDGTIYEHYWKLAFSGDATGFGSGAAANTWHEITAQNFNDGKFTHSNLLIVVTFANANTTYGYTGQLHIQCGNTGANTASVYAGTSIMGCDPAGTFGYQLPLTVATHTGTSSLVMEAKMEVPSSGGKYLYIRSNVAQTSNSAVFGVPQLYVLSRKWIET